MGCSMSTMGYSLKREDPLGLRGLDVRNLGGADTIVFEVIIFTNFMTRIYYKFSNLGLTDAGNTNRQVRFLSKIFYYQSCSTSES